MSTLHFTSPKTNLFHCVLSTQRHRGEADCFHSGKELIGGIGLESGYWDWDGVGLGLRLLRWELMLLWKVVVIDDVVVVIDDVVVVVVFVVIVHIYVTSRRIGRLVGGFDGCWWC